MSRALFLAAILSVSSAATITWTGIVNDQQWGTVNNWYPAQVPGPNDDVVINDAEGKDAVVVLTSPVGIQVRSLTIGTSGSNSKVRALCPLSVSTTLDVGTNGILEVNSGAANLSAVLMTVKGEWNFFAGRFTGNATVSGIANFGQQSAKIFDTAVVRIQSKQPVLAGGSVQFSNNSHVEATTGISASGSNFQCLVVDASTANSFMALDFAWQQ